MRDRRIRIRMAIEEARQDRKIFRRQGSAGQHVLQCYNRFLVASRTDSHGTDGHGASSLETLPLKAFVS
jgi:hypothetical protein